MNIDLQNLSSKEVSPRVEEGVVSVIEIPFEGGSYELGMTLIGGLDTPLIYIMIQEIFPNGAIHKDGRLRVNDQVCTVSWIKLYLLSHFTPGQGHVENFFVISLDWYGL